MNTNKLIYLGSPYSKYAGGVEEAYQKICAVAGKLMEEGYKIFCPISHTHGIQQTIGDKNGDWWLAQDFAVLDRCDELWIVRLPGWYESYGVTKELEYAHKSGIPVKFIDYDG